MARLFQFLTPLLILTLAQAQAATPDTPSILILNSYHPGYIWSDEEYRGLTETLRSAFPKIDPFVDYLDTKHHADLEHILHLVPAFRHKYYNHKIDLLIVLDNPALTFSIKHRRAVFTNHFPIFFLGINGFDESMIKDHADIMGLPEKLDIEGTLRAIRQLQPEIKEIVFITDHSETGTGSIHQIKRDIVPFQNQFHFRFLDQAPIFEDTLDVLKKLPPSSAVVPLAGSAVTRSGLTLSASQQTELISQSTASPVYGLHSQRLTHGIVGGSLLEGYEHGRQAALMIIKFLKGTPLSKIEIPQETQGKLYFDFNELHRFQIPLKKIPPNSTIVNQPTSYFQRNRAVIIASLAVSIVLTSVIILLTVHIFRRRRAEARLRLQYTISSLLTAARPEDPIEDTILQTICETAGWDFGAFWSLDEKRHSTSKPQVLKCKSTYSRSQTEVYAFEQLSRQTMFAKHEGLPGYVWGTHEPRWIGDLRAEIKEILKEFPFPRYALAEKIGFRSAFAFPLQSGNDFFGVIEFFRFTTAPANPSVLQMFTSTANQIAQYLGRRHVELDLISAEESAVSANRAKSDFLANMSHEIRTPLNSVIGIADILKDTELNSDQKQYVNTLLRSGDTLLTLVNEILDLSKVESGTIDIQTVPFDLIDEIKKTLEVFSVRAKQKGLELNFRISPDLIPHRLGDPDRIKQILINLLANAVKFTKEGQIQVSVKPLQHSDRKDMDFVLFSVSDTGIGISKDQIDRIFSRFSQSDSTISRDYGGTGLGLSIARQLIDLMKGTICVESVPGKGSIFYFELPLKIVPPETQIGPEPARESIDLPILPLRILIAEDTEDNQALLAAYFKKTPHQIQFVENGQLAIEARKTEKFDLILMDIQMPIIDGITATRLIRDWERNQGDPPIPIIALTAYALQEELDKCLQAGANSALTKPIKKIDLLREIARVSHQKESTPELNIDPMIADLVPSFLENRRKDLERIHAALNTFDYAVVERIGHQIKGTAGGYGFTGLGRIGAELEAAAKAKNALLIADLFSQMKDYLERVDALRKR